MEQNNQTTTSNMIFANILQDYNRNVSQLIQMHQQYQQPPPTRRHETTLSQTTPAVFTSMLRDISPSTAMTQRARARTPMTNLSRPHQPTPYPTSTRTTTAATATSPEIITVEFELPVDTPRRSGSTTRQRMTQNQIQKYTRMFLYQIPQNNETTEHDDGDTQQQQTPATTCPISHRDFVENDIVCEIKRCKHVFIHEELMRWFDINNTCPVCRACVIDEEDTETTSATNPDNTAGNYDEIIQEAIQSLFSTTANNRTTRHPIW